jgi:hypothetical protein
VSTHRFCSKVRIFSGRRSHELIALVCLRRTYDELHAVAKKEGVSLSMYEDAVNFTSGVGSSVVSTRKAVNKSDDREVRSSVVSCPQDVCVEKTVARFSYPTPNSGNR